jgi:co-chaperonin GroES (HSP10)
MIKPAGHRVLVRPDKLEDTDPVYAAAKKAGIELARKDDFKREQAAVDQGVVISLGSTAFKDFGGEPWCGEGDYIAYARHAGKYVTDPETKEEFIILNDEDVVAVLKGEAKDA